MADLQSRIAKLRATGLAEGLRFVEEERRECLRSDQAKLGSERVSQASSTKPSLVEAKQLSSKGSPSRPRSAEARFLAEQQRSAIPEVYSSIVEMSPGSCPNSLAFSTRRIIFPDRVFGSDGTTSISCGTAIF